MSEERDTVASVTATILAKISASLELSSGKATLANLRNSIGQPINQTASIWPLMFENLPNEFLGTDSYISAEEQAILASLQLLALHQQGKSSFAHEFSQGKFQENIGEALKNLRSGDDIQAMDRRFNVMITSTTFEELVHHLRQMIKLLKSKADTTINYAKLAQDLYWFLKGYDDNIRLNWARSYYKISSKNKQGEENEN